MFLHRSFLTFGRLLFVESLEARVIFFVTFIKTTIVYLRHCFDRFLYWQPFWHIKEMHNFDILFSDDLIWSSTIWSPLSSMLLSVLKEQIHASTQIWKFWYHRVNCCCLVWYFGTQADMNVSQVDLKPAFSEVFPVLMIVKRALLRILSILFY